MDVDAAEHLPDRPGTPESEEDIPPEEVSGSVALYCIPN
jgi:hypothetical protein